MKPTPHHKTAYKTKGSMQSWYMRHTKLFTDLAEELGFEVIALVTQTHVVQCSLRKEGFGDFIISLMWDQDGMSTVRLVSNCTDSTVCPYQTWSSRGKTHNDADLGNWFLKTIRKDWVETNRPNKSLNNSRES